MNDSNKGFAAMNLYNEKGAGFVAKSRRKHEEQRMNDSNIGFAAMNLYNDKGAGFGSKSRRKYDEQRSIAQLCEHAQECFQRRI